MSKMDELRALREARYAQEAAAGTRPPAKRTARQAPEAPATAPRDAGAEAPDAGLCGHRAISGRTCTRERGHSAKSHRYS